MNLDDLDRYIRENRILALNIQFDADGFRVHVRPSLDRGFACAQKSHERLADALREHMVDRPVSFVRDPPKLPMWTADTSIDDLI